MFFNDEKIADSKEKEQILKGIQPKHQGCFRVFRTARFFCVGFLGLALLLTILPLFGDLGGAANHQLYNPTKLLLVLASILAGVVAFVVKALFLRKPPFDDWVYEIAKAQLGTEVIFYDSKRLYIQFDRKLQEKNKKEFVTEMSDKSIHYSYFYVKTFIDEGVIVVECTKRQPIPKKASFSAEDDKLWNVFPIGLTIHPVLQTIAPMGWYLNDMQKNPDMLDTIPSVSMLIAGGTGCYEENTVIPLYNNIVQ